MALWSKKSAGTGSCPASPSAVYEALSRSQAVCWLDLDGTIIEANEKFLDLFGYQRPQLVGKNHNLLVDGPDQRTPEYQQFWDALRRGEPTTGIYRRMGKGGRELFVRGTFASVLGPDGKPDKIFKIASDVTENRIANADAKGQVAAIARSQAVIQFDLDGTILEANDNFLKTMGYSAREIIGKKHALFQQPERVASAEYANFWKELRAGKPQIGQYRSVGKGGREVWIQASYNPIFDPSGNPYKVIKYAMDITDQKVAVIEIAERFSSLAAGDLTARLSNRVGGEFSDLRDGFNSTMERLGQVFTQIMTSTQSISGEIETVSSAATDLSSRAEAQAAALEESAASMEDIANTVRANSETASEARGIADEASDRAQKGAQVVQSAVEAMDLIEESSNKVSDIVSVIEGIAFQTNLLALNAAVEAARAGHSGKGFAVVAAEVRTLAQRSSDAARDITSLIQESVGKVKDGAVLVRQTGDALGEINSAIGRLVDHVGSISESSELQTGSVMEVTQALNGMDQNTQQNALMADQSVANAQRLAELIADLGLQTAFFKLDAQDKAKSTAHKAAS